MTKKQIHCIDVFWSAAQPRRALTDACRNVLADIGAAIQRQQAALQKAGV